MKGIKKVIKRYPLYSYYQSYLLYYIKCKDFSFYLGMSKYKYI